jgi:hypothetical protein
MAPATSELSEVNDLWVSGCLAGWLRHYGGFYQAVPTQDSTTWKNANIAYVHASSVFTIHIPSVRPVEIVPYRQRGHCDQLFFLILLKFASLLSN